MGYLRGVVHGALVGACLGLLYAPDAGAVTRKRVSRWLQEAEGILGGGSTSQPSPQAAAKSPGVATRPRRQPAP